MHYETKNEKENLIMLFMEILVATVLIYCACWTAGYFLVSLMKRRNARKIAERQRRTDFVNEHIEVRADGRVYLK